MLVSVLVSATAGAQPKPDLDVAQNLTVPPPDLAPRPAKAIAAPAVPSFDVPPPNADGTHTIKEMRVYNKRYLDAEVTLKGFVTWRYDCMADVRLPTETVREAQKRIDEDPTLCERPKLYLGDQATTKREVSVWVVDLPRVYNRLELQRIKKKERTDPNKCEPDERDPKKKICPPYAVGDEVEITGTWKLSSPHSERNSEGLLVYSRMKNITQKWETPGPKPAIASPTAAAYKPYLEPGIPVAVKPKPVIVKASRLAESQKYQAEGVQAYGQKQWGAAVTAYLRAVVALPSNHVAHHGLARSHAMRGEWTDAAAEAKLASSLDPSAASYRELLGWMLYEKTIADERLDVVRKTGLRPDEIDVELSTLDFEKGLVELRHAVAYEPRAWRAHYLIGAIHRHAGRAVQAAKALTRAIELGAPEASPWISLVELYRSWDYTDQAILVAEQGLPIVAGTDAQARLWLALGAAYEDKLLGDKAVDALTKALAAKPDLHAGRFLRGQVYFRMGAFAKAKPDLEEYAKSAGRRDGFYRSQASRMLMDIAAKTASP